MKINKEVKNQETEREVPVLLCWEWEGVAGVRWWWVAVRRDDAIERIRETVRVNLLFCFVFVLIIIKKKWIGQPGHVPRHARRHLCLWV
jgi:hypothetical protein